MAVEAVGCELVSATDQSVPPLAFEVAPFTRASFRRVNVRQWPRAVGLCAGENDLAQRGRPRVSDEFGTHMIEGIADREAIRLVGAAE